MAIRETAPSEAETISDVAARLDRLPSSRYVWLLVVLLSFGAFFEIYDVLLSAPLSLGLLAAVNWRKG